MPNRGFTSSGEAKRRIPLWGQWGETPLWGWGDKKTAKRHTQLWWAWVNAPREADRARDRALSQLCHAA